jgi:hypothetical protein
MGYYYAINMGCNSLWLLLFGTSQFLAFILISLMTFTSVKIYIYSATAAATNKFEKVILQGGFFIYSSWLIAATIMNATILIEQVGISHFQCLRICLFVYISIMIYVQLKNTDLSPVLIFVFVWVSFGIKGKGVIAIEKLI